MNAKKIDISFVILTWNSEAYVASCFESIWLTLEASKFTYEVIVVDNGSTDQTANLLNAYREKHPGQFRPIFLLHNQGTTLSRNIGLKQVRGQFVCIMDSDVELSAGLFEPLMSTLTDATDIGLVVPKIHYPSGNWQKSFDQFPTLVHKLKRFFNLKKMEAREEKLQQGKLGVRPVDYAISAFWLFKRELLENVGYLDEKIFYSPEDVDYCLRIWRAGYKILYVPQVNIVHHTQEISRGFSLNKAKLSHIKGLFYLFYKHGYFLRPPQFGRQQGDDLTTGTDLTGLQVMHVFDHSLPIHDGYSFRSMNIMREQQRKGWHPIGLTSPRHEQDLQSPGPADEMIEGFTFYRSGYVRNRQPIIGDLFQMYILMRRILTVDKQENVDLVHAHSSILNGIPALWAARKLKKPLVYEIRAFWEDAAVDQGGCKEWGLRYRFTRWLETKVCKHANQVAILCDGLKQDLVARGIPADKITPVFNGVNPDDFKPCAADEEYRRAWQLEGKTIIGFIGSFYRYEGLDLLISAFAQLAADNPNTVLLLVGGGEMEAELKTLIATQGLTDRVVLPGRIPHERVPGVYAMIDILAYPRYSMRLTELVTPLKPLEAMAMGKALVASNVGGHRELISDGETGVLFKAGDASALADALAGLLTAPEKRERLQHQALDWVHREHTWERTTAVYRDIYGKLNLPQTEAHSAPTKS